MQPRRKTDEWKDHQYTSANPDIEFRKWYGSENFYSLFSSSEGQTYCITRAKAIKYGISIGWKFNS